MAPICKTRAEKVKELLEKATLRGECLISHLAPNAKGYVPVQIGGRMESKWRAHRLVYCELVEEVPDHMMVLHSCDVRNCINIKHLTVGSAKMNTQDMMSRGRHKYESHRKVSEEVYGEIVAYHEKGFSNVKIGDYLNISHETVRFYVSCYQNGEGFSA
jgi:hypothetical protein